MSHNNTINTTPGLKQAVPLFVEKTLVAKITGRNIAAITYIVSLEAERREVQLSVEAGFDTDGSLLGIIIRDGERQSTFLLPPNYFVILQPDAIEAQLVSPADFQRNFKLL